MYLLINSFDALRASNGDRIRCTYSMKKERIGNEFIVAAGYKKYKEIEPGLGIIGRSMLSFWSSYGDKFEMVEKKNAKS